MTAPGRNVAPAPEVRVTRRFPRMRRIRIGEKRDIVSIGVQQRGETIAWSSANVLVIPPTNEVQTITVTPSGAGGNEYHCLVDFVETGIWNIVFTYSPGSSATSEIMKEYQRIRVVS